MSAGVYETADTSTSAQELQPTQGQQSVQAMRTCKLLKSAAIIS